MAENDGPIITSESQPEFAGRPQSIDEARALARERFRTRLEQGEKIGECECHSEDGAALNQGSGPSSRVAGVRFLDSGQTFYFDPVDLHVDLGDWVVVETSRGREAGRVVIAPHQVKLNLLRGELKPLLRRLNDADVEKMNRLKRDAATAVKTFGAKIREHTLQMKPVSAEYNFDGSHLTLNFSAPERVDFRDLARDLSSTFQCRVELKQVGPRDEARLLGGLGRCGRTLCCSSWLPVYPEISMNMAKTQDLPINPSKVSGVCGRLLCCLSYENEQYKQMKSVMPRLGQPIETAVGSGTVISMQILKQLVTVRMSEDNTDHVFPIADLGFSKPEPRAPRSDGQHLMQPHGQGETAAETLTTDPQSAEDGARSGGRRRRRRRGRGRSESPQA
jgi:cell fate regulator YaaT (PSP1 superfamily)